MPSQATCAGCGAPLPAGRPGAFCVGCLLLGALTPLPAAPPDEEEPASATRGARPLRVGDYELLEPIARGGMGSVWRARQVSANRLVAYKTVASGLLASSAERRRFQTEIETAAQLDHPNIVPIYEVGDDDGRPFFTMRLMEGGTLAGWGGNAPIDHARIEPLDRGAAQLGVPALAGPDDQAGETANRLKPGLQTGGHAEGKGERDLPRPPLSQRAAAAVLLKVARAVGFAHERGILHRDLKPGNILLDAAGEPFVADFGLARRLELDSTLTQSGDLVGTPAYLAPEVATGGSRHATIASDIYSLGAILYELLTGRPPFTAPTIPELLRSITEDDPVPPSVLRGKQAAGFPAKRRTDAVLQSGPHGRGNAAVGEGARAPTAGSGSAHGDPCTPQRPAPLRTSAFGLLSDFGLRTSDLDIICLKCLAKHPAARYPTASALADDLECWLRGEPIQARAPSLVEFGLRWARKHRVAAALLGVAAILPAIIISGLLWANAFSRREREQTRLNLYAADMATAALALEQGNHGQASQALATHEPRAGERDLRGFEWRWLRQRALGDATTKLQVTTGTVGQITFSPDGRWLAAASNDGKVTLMDVARREVVGQVDLLKVVPPDPNSPLPRGLARGQTLLSVSISPDNRRVVVVAPRGLWVWDVPSLRLAATNGLECFWALFLPGRTNEILVSHREPVATRWWGDQANRLTVLDADLHRFRDFGDATNYYGSLSADGGTLVSYDYRTASVWNTTNAALLQRFRGNGAFHRIALSPDGHLAAICYQMQPVVELWDPLAGRQLGQFTGHTANAVSAAFSPDGSWLATGAEDETIRLWDVATQRELRVMRGHELAVLSLAFSPDGKLLASWGQDGSVLFWDLPALGAAPPARSANAASPLVFSADGRRLASGLRDGGVGSLSLPDRRLVQTWPQLHVEDLVRNPEGGGFLVLGRASPGSSNLVALTVNADSAAPRRFGKLNVPAAQVTAAALTPDGRLCFTGDTNGVLLCWDVATGQRLGATPGPNHPIENLRCAPDGRRLIGYNRFQTALRSWSAVPCRLLATNIFGGRNNMALAFAPDGAECATGNLNNSFQLWDVDTLNLHWVSPPTRSGVTLLSYSPDGQTLATASLDGKLRLWHLPTRRPLLTLLDRPTSQPRLLALAFSPDGQWLAACDASGELHLWPAPR